MAKIRCELCNNKRIYVSVAESGRAYYLCLECGRIMPTATDSEPEEPITEDNCLAKDENEVVIFAVATTPNKAKI